MNSSAAASSEPLASSEGALQMGVSHMPAPHTAATHTAAPPSRPRGNAEPIQLRTSSPPKKLQEPYVTVTPESNVEQWARAISVAIVDVVSGRIGARSIERWLSPKAFAVLSRGVSGRESRRGALPGWAISSRVFPQGKGHYEFTATIWDQDHARAVAGHIAAFRGRWLVTELEL